MKRSQRARKPRQVRTVQLPPGADPIEPRSLIEAMHPDCVFDRLARTLKAWILQRMKNGDNVLVNLGEKRLFKRNSSSQYFLRNASVLKSRKGKITGFLIL
jgi:hypothetical protein